MTHWKTITLAGFSILGVIGYLITEHIVPITDGGCYETDVIYGLILVASVVAYMLGGWVVDTHVPVPGEEKMKTGFIIDIVLGLVIIAIVAIYGDLSGVSLDDFSFIVIKVVILVSLTKIAVWSILSLLGCD